MVRVAPEVCRVGETTTEFVRFIAFMQFFYINLCLRLNDNNLLPYFSY